tara:strand:- start:451 stop:828 length:378 start_codon:yes stop_codon:yes gene_type:complete
MNERRIIKKYPNRRLYDTKDSKYITLEDIGVLVSENKEFVVIDTKTGEERTKNILLQIIIDKEQNSVSIFSTEVLIQIIQSYENSYHNVMDNRLKKNIEELISQHKKQQKHTGPEITKGLINNED